MLLPVPIADTDMYMLISCFDICKRPGQVCKLTALGFATSFIQCILWMQLYLTWRPTGSEGVRCTTSMSNINMVY